MVDMFSTGSGRPQSEECGYSKARCMSLTTPSMTAELTLLFLTLLSTHLCCICRVHEYPIVMVIKTLSQAVLRTALASYDQPPRPPRSLRPGPLPLARLTVARPLAKPTPRPRDAFERNMGAFLPQRSSQLHLNDRRIPPERFSPQHVRHNEYPDVAAADVHTIQVRHPPVALRDVDVLELYVHVVFRLDEFAAERLTGVDLDGDLVALAQRVLISDCCDTIQRDARHVQRIAVFRCHRAGSLDLQSPRSEVLSECQSWRAVSDVSLRLDSNIFTFTTFMRTAYFQYKMNISGTLNVLRLFVNPVLCLPQHTVSTFDQLPVPLSNAFIHRAANREKTPDIRAVVLDKDNCFSVPKQNSIYPAYKAKFAELREAYPGSSLLIVSNSSGTSSDKGYIDAELLEASTGVKVLRHDVKKPGCHAEIMEYFRKEGVADRANQVAVVGDRLFTDVLMANVMGSYGVWIKDGVVPDHGLVSGLVGRVFCTHDC
nr:phosphatidylglycerophosphatase gep4, mitochondrial [Quercus suber]